jgi:signal transduction histidine kinase
MEDLNIQVVVDVSETLPIIYSDSILIRQVIFNLLKNALEAMECGGTLTLTPSTDDENVFLKIQDTGTGIAPEAIPQLFTPYYTTKSTGHGLGLTLVMRILKAHGGHLNIQSTPGKGTCFTLQLPKKHKRVRLLMASESPILEKKGAFDQAS